MKRKAESIPSNHMIRDVVYTVWSLPVMGVIIGEETFKMSILQKERVLVESGHRLIFHVLTCSQHVCDLIFIRQSIFIVYTLLQHTELHILVNLTLYNIQIIGRKLIFHWDFVGQGWLKKGVK